MLKDSKGRLVKWWSEPTGRQQLGYLLAGLGITLTLILALVRGFTTLSAGWSLLVAVVGVVFQGVSAFVFGGVGKADPTHAQASVSHLWTLAQRTTQMKKAAQDSYERRPIHTQSEFHGQMGILSAELSWIEEDALEAIEHWRLFHEQAVEKVVLKKTKVKGPDNPQPDCMTAQNVQDTNSNNAGSATV